MRIPVIRGLIDRRILVNFRIDADVLQDVLPKPFRPRLIHGHGMAGICLIRLAKVGPRLLPDCVGWTSENAAHRVAVEWGDPSAPCQGVYIPRRDTSSQLNTWLGGRVFPGIHHRARFTVNEFEDRYQIQVASDDGDCHLTVDARSSSMLPGDSVFQSLQEASQFFADGSLGYSDTANPGEFDGLELKTWSWKVEPLAVENVASSYFDSRERFPIGSVEFDCALLMRNVKHEWHGRPTLSATRPAEDCDPNQRAAALIAGR